MKVNCYNCQQRLELEDNTEIEIIQCPVCNMKIDIGKPLARQAERQKEEKNQSDSKRMKSTEMNIANIFFNRIKYALFGLISVIIIFIVWSELRAPDNSSKYVSEDIDNNEKDLSGNLELSNTYNNDENNEDVNQTKKPTKQLPPREAYRFYWGIRGELHKMKLTRTSYERGEERYISKLLLEDYIDLHNLIEQTTDNKISRLGLLYYCLNATSRGITVDQQKIVEYRLKNDQQRINNYLKTTGYNYFLKGNTPIQFVSKKHEVTTGMRGITRVELGYIKSVYLAKAYIKRYPKEEFDWRNNYKIFTSQFRWPFKKEMAQLAKEKTY